MSNEENITDFLGDWKNFFLQGLVGMGLVGYNTLKFFLKKINSEPIVDYAEFFPQVAVIEEGKIENQCPRIYSADIGKERRIYGVIGPQPRSDELSASFLGAFLRDFKKIHEESKIDLFISFGAFITDVIDVTGTAGGFGAAADRLLDHELTRSRGLYIATCGGLSYDEFALSVQHPDDKIVKEPQGFISGLNGVLPALIGERFKIPTVTIMVESASAEKFRFNSAVAQLLGLLASRKGLEFLDHYFGLDMDLRSLLTPIIDELLPAARQDLISSMERGEPERREDSSDKMYT